MNVSNKDQSHITEVRLDVVCGFKWMMRFSITFALYHEIFHTGFNRYVGGMNSLVSLLHFKLK